jgi:hypothetical protein
MKPYKVRIGTPDRHWSDDAHDDEKPVMAASAADAMRQRVDAHEGEVVEVCVFGPDREDVTLWVGFGINDAEDAS